jgi:hypothetical protein
MSASAHLIEDRWTPFCNECRELGWIPIEGRGSKKCKCRAHTRLEQIPPLYEGLRLETMTPDLRCHPKQGVVLETVRNNPDACYFICGRPGAGKTFILHALHARTLLLGRPAMVISLIKLVEDYRQAVLARPEDSYVPLLSPVSLETRSERWLVGIDDFHHFCPPTDFVAKKIFWLLDTIRSFRHQLVVTSQFDENELERRLAKTGIGLAEALMERILKIGGLIRLNLF